MDPLESVCAETRFVVELRKVVNMTGELCAGVNFPGEISVAPGLGAPATRIRAGLPPNWPAEFLYLDGGKPAHFGKERGEKGYPKGFHTWASRARTCMSAQGSLR
jgi:hypothetical protein